jgi:hypothetical protein
MRREIVKREKSGTKGTCRLKGGNTHAVMDNYLVALLCKGTLAGIRGAIIEEILPIRQTGEGEDLKKQRDDWRGRDIKLTSYWSTKGVEDKAPSVKSLEKTISKEQGKG